MCVCGGGARSKVGVRVGSNADEGGEKKNTGIKRRKDGEIRSHKKAEE